MLKALVFQRVESTYLSRHWFKIQTCTPYKAVIASLKADYNVNYFVSGTGEMTVGLRNQLFILVDKG